MHAGAAAVHSLWTVLCTQRPAKDAAIGVLWLGGRRDYTSLTASTDGAEHGTPGPPQHDVGAGPIGDERAVVAGETS